MLDYLYNIYIKYLIDLFNIFKALFKFYNRLYLLYINLVFIYYNSFYK